MSVVRVPISQDQIRAFCQKWKIRELSVFGSVLRDDFRPDSDVDVLIELFPDHGLSLYEFVDIQSELEAMVGRKVDVVLKGGLRNPLRRRMILDSRQVLYAA